VKHSGAFRSSQFSTRGSVDHSRLPGQWPGDSGWQVEFDLNLWQTPVMDIEVTDFSDIQRLALFDLLILAMCADGHLPTIEDDLLEQLLTAMGHTDELDRQREFDGAVTRIRPFVQSIQKAKSQALLLASAFTVRNQQKKVYAAVQQIMTVDEHVSSWESSLPSELRLTFRL
jgi:hypothetical protein